MPDPNEWYNKPNAKEIVSNLYDNAGTEIRFRRRFLTEKVGNSKKKQVILFSIGLEISVKGKWNVIVRHCNAHDTEKAEFHTHNEYTLPCLGNETRIKRRLYTRKVSLQMGWALNDITNNYLTYIKEFFDRKKGYYEK